MKANGLSFDGIMLAAQIGAALLAPVALLLAPPAAGQMLLIPLGQVSAVVYAREHGALLLGTGAIPGSIVVSGARARLLANPARTGVLVLAATPAGCGTGQVPTR